MNRSLLISLALFLSGTSGLAWSAEGSWEHYPGFQGPGYTGIVVGDFNGDGAIEAAVSGFGYEGFTPLGTQLVALLSANSSGQLSVSALSALPFTLGDSLVLARSEGNADQLVSTTNLLWEGQMVVLGDVPIRALRTIPAPLVTRVYAVADVDADGRLEIVATNRLAGWNDYPAIYDYETGALEWTGSMPVRTVAAAQLDESPSWELILSGEDGLIVDGATRITKWSYPGGFGHEIAVGYFGDDPARLTFAANQSSRIQVFGADPFRLITQFPTSEMAVGAIAAPSSTGGDRIALGDQQSGNVALYDPRSGQRIRATQMPPYDSGVSQVAAADLDGDGHLELVYGSGLSHTGTDWLRAIDAETLETDYARAGELGPHTAVAIGDLSGEGREEVVHVTLKGSGRPLPDGPVLRVLNGETGEVVRSKPRLIETALSYPPHVSLAQLDSDPALEIVVAATYGYSAMATVLDGVTLNEQWRSNPNAVPLANAPMTDMVLADADGDGVQDVILAIRPYGSASAMLSQIVALNGLDGALLWQSPIVSGPISGEYAGAHLAVIETPDDSTLVAMAAEPGIFVFNLASGLLEANAVPAAPVSALLQWGSGPDCRLGALDSGGRLTLHDCRSLAVVGQRQLPPATTFLRTADARAERFVAAAGTDLYLISELDAATRIAGPLGTDLGMTNQGIVTVDPKKQYLDVLIGSDYMVTRRSIAIGPIFTDGFE